MKEDKSEFWRQSRNDLILFSIFGLVTYIVTGATELLILIKWFVVFAAVCAFIQFVYTVSELIKLIEKRNRKR